MPETILVPKKEYEEFIRYRSIRVDGKFNFDEVFGLGTGKLKAQEVKNMLREEW